MHAAQPPPLEGAAELDQKELSRGMLAAIDSSNIAMQAIRWRQ